MFGRNLPEPKTNTNATGISGENELYEEGTKLNPIKSYVRNLAVFVPTLDVVGLS